MRKTEKRASRWRLLSDADVEGILREAGLSLGDNAKQALRHRINEELATANRMNTPYASSGEYIKSLRKFRDAARRLQDAWRPLTDRNLAWARDFLVGHPNAERSGTVEELRQEFPEWDEDVFQLAQARGVPVPSADAKRAVARARYLLKQVELWALMGEALEHARMDHGGPGVRRPGKQDDDAGHRLISQLGEVYADAFSLPPAATRNGPWYAFLAAVLAQSEGTQLNDDQVHEKVLRARRHERQAEEAARALLALTIEREDQVGFRAKNKLH